MTMPAEPTPDAPEAAPETPPAGAEPEGTTPAPTPSAPEGAPEGAATADSHGSQDAADQANATAALDGDQVAFDALPPQWQAEVRRLRDESAESRVKANRYAKPFSSLEPHEQDWLLALAQDLGDPDKQAEAARRMQAVAGSLLEGVQEPEDTEQPLTLSQLREIQAQEAAQAQQDAEVQAIFKEAEDLGYKKDTADFALLMWLSANADKPEEAGDLKAAHAKIEAGRRHIIDTWVAEQKAKGQFPGVVGGGGTPSSASGPPKTIAEASDRARARAEAAKRAAAAATA